MISFQIQFKFNSNSAAVATTCCVHVINTCTTESMVERRRSIRAVDGGHGSRARSVGAEEEEDTIRYLGDVMYQYCIIVQ